MTNDVWLTEREQRAWRGFMGLQNEVRAQLSRRLQQETGLSGADYDLLVVLSEAPSGRLRAFEMGALIKWEKSRLSHQLTRMAQRGLIERQACTDDSRYAEIVLTPVGRAAIVEAAPKHVAHVREVFIDVLSPEQIDAFAAIAETVLTRLDNQPD
ncbi:MAG TPA: MarR family winged helix-turn-helix transcriptional regulator [Streptosporangiaceae bacterium]|nr:MarR family winged helix-turn-helix transcriptional regulator [Streptosporangiaceae bacterium]